MDAAKENITLIIGGDVCPMGRVEEYFCSGDAVNIFHDLLDDLKNSDLTVVNLESPLITKSNPILKSGPALSAQTGCVKGLFQSGIQVVSLANNHIFDHGCEGLLTTGVSGNETSGGKEILSGLGIYCDWWRRRPCTFTHGDSAEIRSECSGRDVKEEHKQAVESEVSFPQAGVLG